MKGPIFHKLLYRLSREQQRQFREEEDWYNEIGELQTTVNSVFFGCAGGCGCKIQVHTYAIPKSSEFFAQADDHLTTFCKHCGKQTEFREIIRLGPKKTEEIIKVESAPKRYDLQNRVNHILSQLRELSVEQTVTPDGLYYTQQVAELLNELKGVLDQLVSKQSRHLEKLSAGIRRRPIQDLRQKYRSVSAFLFKNLPDFSGCEDEAYLTEPTVRQIHSFSKIRKLCSTKQYHYLWRSIPLSNLRMTD